jgi:hypothetical protein
MRNTDNKTECTCELPYVDNRNANVCSICGKSQKRFSQANKITLERKLNGSEYKPGDIVEVIGKSFACLVKIRYYIMSGWYTILLPNGALYDTKILGDVVIAAEDNLKDHLQLDFRTQHLKHYEEGYKEGMLTKILGQEKVWSILKIDVDRYAPDSARSNSYKEGWENAISDYDKRLLKF